MFSDDDGCDEPCGTCDQQRACGGDDECGEPFYMSLIIICLKKKNKIQIYFVFHFFC